jgi:hypothetical protein
MCSEHLLFFVFALQQTERYYFIPTLAFWCSGVKLWIQNRSDRHNLPDPDRERYPGPANPHPDQEPDPDHLNQMKNYDKL